jgi:cytochrome c oxidase subunit II
MRFRTCVSAHPLRLDIKGSKVVDRMRNGNGSPTVRHFAALSPVVPLLAGCELPIALDPRGPAAAEIARIWWILFVTAAVVSLVVFALLGIAVVRARAVARARDAYDLGDVGGDAAGPPTTWLQGRTTGFVLIGGGLVPTIVLVAATFLTLSGLAAFDDDPDDVATTIQVVGHMFWWEVVYPDHGVTTANEIHLPVGRNVRFELTSADVIHSFWVPQLHGKMEMIPGRTNVLHLAADEPGVYVGKCAEFCGQQHANMELLVVVEPEADFEAWIEAQAADARAPVGDLAERGREVFVDSPCALCHTIRGVSEGAEAGPDLTHLATRRTLAARTLVNVRGNLGGWILDPQGIKPGSRMPAVDLPADDFLALLAYLDGLRGDPR